MVNAIMAKMVADLQAQQSTGFTEGVTLILASQKATQPTDNSPLVQIKFVAELPPRLVQGRVINGLPSGFEQSYQFELWLSSTADMDRAWPEVFRLWFGDDFKGVKTVVLGWLSGGSPLVVNSHPFLVEQVAEMRPAPSSGAWSANLVCPLRITTAWSQ